MDTETLERVRKYALVAESPGRYEHSLRVADAARELCETYNFDGDKGYFAGLAHDMCKDMSPHMILSMVANDGKPITSIEKEKPALLHGRAAAALLKKDFGVTDNEILEAVSVHTFGAPDMGNLAKILYVADKIEPGRPQVTEEYLDRLSNLSLDELVIFVLKENIEYLETRGKKISPATRKLLSALEG